MAAYPDWFFESQALESCEAAAVVAPILLKLNAAQSVLDVGGGVGAWSAAFSAAGVEDILCVDGEYVNRAKLLVRPEQFEAHDLTRPLDLGRRFDMCVSLEVGEHLRAESAAGFVESLTRHSDVVVFSAAIPHQGGHDHVNERWPSYWRDLFGVHGYELLDVIRPRIWNDERVGFWFRQNMVIYATGSDAQRFRFSSQSTPPIDVVHPQLWLKRNEPQQPTIRESLGLVRGALERRFRSS